MMLRILVAVALSKSLMRPELIRFTVPPALLVIPTTVPDPLRFRVPVLVKFARAVEMGPVANLLAVPALARVVMETVPLMLREPDALLVKVPAPERVFPTLRMPL